MLVSGPLDALSERTSQVRISCDVTMAGAPEPLECTCPDCTFTTPPTYPDWEAMLRVLQKHTDANHRAPQGDQSNGQASISNSKLEKLPMPTFSNDMTQSDYAFKESQWEAYIGLSVTSEQVKVQQLRAACDEDLLCRVNDAGGLQGLNTEKDLLKQIKKLGVRVVHKTHHLQNMWQMKQDPEEPLIAFCSRLVGTADLCGSAPALPATTRPAIGTRLCYRPC